jgi:hypothetical protein
MRVPSGMSAAAAAARTESVGPPRRRHASLGGALVCFFSRGRGGLFVCKFGCAVKSQEREHFSLPPHRRFRFAGMFGWFAWVGRLAAFAVGDARRAQQELRTQHACQSLRAAPLVPVGDLALKGKRRGQADRTVLAGGGQHPGTPEYRPDGAALAGGWNGALTSVLEHTSAACMQLWYLRTVRACLRACVRVPVQVRSVTGSRSRVLRWRTRSCAARLRTKRSRQAHGCPEHP